MSSRIKLLIYSHDWFPDLGGVQTVTLSLATGLAQWVGTNKEQSFEVVFVTQTPRRDMDDSRLPFRVVRRPSTPELVGLVRWADVINLAGPTFLPLAIAWLLKKPTVVDHHGYQSVCPNGMLVYEPNRSVCPGNFMAGRYLKCVQCNKKEMGLKGSIRNLFLTFPRRWLAKRATANIGVSPHVTERIELPRSTTIWNGVASPAEPLSPAELGRDSPLICFCYLGRLVTEKGVAVLIEASRILAAKGYDFRVRIVGDGPERGNLEQLAEGPGLSQRVEFVGFVPSAEIKATLRGVSVIVMPSICEETAGLAAMEQMMEGRLLIASDIGGLGLVADGGGLKFPVADAAGLAARMSQVIENPSLIQEIGSKGRAFAMNTFSQQRMVAQHVAIYREVGRPD
jgi:glycosyltransferase involved in cell wall biosynthesis